MYVYVSICMYIFICTYCTYMIVCVCICQRHKYRYMHIRAYTYNTYTYVHTYRICTMCKCTYWIVFLVEYVTHFWNTNKIRTHTNNMVHWCQPDERGAGHDQREAGALGQGAGARTPPPAALGDAKALGDHDAAAAASANSGVLNFQNLDKFSTPSKYSKFSNV